MANGQEPTCPNPALQGPFHLRRVAGVRTSGMRVLGLPVAAILSLQAMSCSARTDMDPVSSRAAFSSKSRSLHATAPETTLATAATPPISSPASAPADPATSFSEAPPQSEVTAIKHDGAPTAGDAAAATVPVSPAVSPAESYENQHAVAEPPAASSEATITQVQTTGGPASASSEPTEPRAILEAAARSTWPSLRAYAMEAAIGRPRLLAEHASRALADENRGVRFVTCMAIAQSGQVQYVDLLRPLLADPSDSVRAAAMLALSRSGERVNLTPLAAMLQSDDPEVRSNAQLVLGELGNASAAPLIRDSLGQGMTLVNPLRVRLIDLSAAEALVKLGQNSEVEPIRAALFAPPEQGELTVVACDAVRRIRDGGSIPMLERIATVRGRAERSPEIRLAAARALQALGVRQGPLAVATPLASHPDARVRAQAAIVLGEVGTAEARSLLEPLLRDADPSVKVAAAAGLDLSEAGPMSAIGASVGPRN